MRKFSTILFYSFFILPVAKSQAVSLQTEQWAEKPALHVIESKLQNEPALVILDNRRFEYIDDTKNGMHMYYTVHKIIHVNNDHGIEYFNKVYILMDGVSETREIHARAILPGGKVVEVLNENIKDIKDEDGHSYKIFAIEGLEKGSEIEYYYTVDRNTVFFGRELFQERFPVLASSLELVFPKRLIFDVKPYNCKPISSIDTTKSGKTVLHIDIPELVGADKEKYSSYSANMARLEYKLSYNSAKGSDQRLFTWNELAKKVYSIYSTVTPKDASRIKDFVNGKDWSRLKEDSDKIMAVENFVKDNFAYREEAGENGDDLEKILKNKIASMIGLMRLYGAIFSDLQINYQFVLTTDRNNLQIDKNFENWNNCDYAVFYFPDLHGYLVPTKPGCRYPLIDPDWAGANGLFCKNVSIGGMNTAIAEVKPIQLEDFRKSYNNLDITLNLNKDLDSLLIDSRFIFGGYTAIHYREPFNLATEDQKKEIFKSMSKNQLNTETIIRSDIENLSYEDANKSKPFIVHQTVSSGDLVERAAEKILVKVGLVIGPQVEMYQEKLRRTPIRIDYPQTENRRIRFVIPAGYRIKNPEDVNIRQVYEENGIQSMGFVSSYTLKDNELNIDILEDYRKEAYPISLYDQFVKIINASSDFNKVVLVLEKK